ncbi:type II toxin-antitoxin system PemK/MazF family toxin [Streptomyces pinistramenti]|uniref:type II toxin-antitoxin system PemK/MazF family toxin n=1 Tax=Streptomyces pinistramenti TaxID=2884812 RepID=UPI00222249A8|nr:type II toxin-antitoxin system PemK/MazF family toxin [Streptomyces pinistramenti]
MRRGEIFLVDHEPARGSEVNKARPAVIVSNDGADAVVDRTGRGVVTLGAPDDERVPRPSLPGAAPRCRVRSGEGLQSAG